MLHRVLLFLILFSLCSCKQDGKVINQKLILAKDSGVHQNDTSVLERQSNSFFSRLNKSESGGLVYTIRIPDPYLEKELYVIFKGKARSNYAVSQGAMVFTAFDEWGQQLCWWAITLRPHLQYQNQWNTFIDSMHIPSLIENRKFTNVKAYTFLGNSPGEVLDIDSFEITLKTRPDY